MTGFKFKVFIESLKMWSAFHCKQHTGLLFRLTFTLPEYTCTFTFLGENVSFDFLPVYVLMPATKMLKEPNE